MGNTLAMLDWPSSAQWAAGAGCGLATLALGGGGGGGGGGGAGAEAGASGAGLVGRNAQRAAATALCAAAALAVGDALLGRWARLPLPGSDSGRRAPLAAAADYDDEEAEGEEAPDKSARGLVVLTGCDSGLGFSLAAHSLRMGLRVAAGCLDADGPGARRLLALAPHGRLTILPLDVTKSKSVLDFTRGIEKILLDEKSLRFLGLVNNAGIMIFGEFEWQTESQVERQIQVNLLGTMRVTRRLCPLLRRHQGRVITVTSHCALEALPGLAPYGATKAALEAWCAALRVEQQKYGVRVITLVPGSFTQTSNIMAHHEQHALEMETNLRQEYPMDWEFYENYFRSYHNYLMYISGDKGVKELNDQGLYFKYECSLLALWPKQQYVHAPMRYNVYHLAMRISPRFLRDQIVKAFMKLPPYQERTASERALPCAACSPSHRPLKERSCGVVAGRRLSRSRPRHRRGPLPLPAPPPPPPLAQARARPQRTPATRAAANAAAATDEAGDSSRHARAAASPLLGHRSPAPSSASVRSTASAASACRAPLRIRLGAPALPPLFATAIAPALLSKASDEVSTEGSCAGESTCSEAPLTSCTRGSSRSGWSSDNEREATREEPRRAVSSQTPTLRPHSQPAERVKEREKRCAASSSTPEAHEPPPRPCRLQDNASQTHTPHPSRPHSRADRRRTTREADMDGRKVSRMSGTSECPITLVPSAYRNSKTSVTSTADKETQRVENIAPFTNTRSNQTDIGTSSKSTESDLEVNQTLHLSEKSGFGNQFGTSSKVKVMGVSTEMDPGELEIDDWYESDLKKDQGSRRHFESTEPLPDISEKDESRTSEPDFTVVKPALSCVSHTQQQVDMPTMTVSDAESQSLSPTITSDTFSQYSTSDSTKKDAIAVEQAAAVVEAETFAEAAALAQLQDVQTAAVVASFTHQALIEEEETDTWNLSAEEHLRGNTRLAVQLRALLAPSGASSERVSLCGLEPQRELAREIAISLRDAVRFEDPRRRAAADPREEVLSVLLAAAERRDGFVVRTREEAAEARVAARRLGLRLARRVLAAAGARDLATTFSACNTHSPPHPLSPTAASSPDEAHASTACPDKAQPAGTQQEQPRTSKSCGAVASAEITDLTADFAREMLANENLQYRRLRRPRKKNVQPGDEVCSEPAWVAMRLRELLAGAQQPCGADFVQALAGEMASAVEAAALTDTQGPVGQVIAEALRQRFKPATSPMVARLGVDLAARIRRAPQVAAQAAARAPAPTALPAQGSRHSSRLSVPSQHSRPSASLQHSRHSIPSHHSKHSTRSADKEDLTATSACEVESCDVNELSASTFVDAPTSYPQEQVGASALRRDRKEENEEEDTEYQTPDETSLADSRRGTASEGFGFHIYSAQKVLKVESGVRGATQTRQVGKQVNASWRTPDLVSDLKGRQKKVGGSRKDGAKKSPVRAQSARQNKDIRRKPRERVATDSSVLPRKSKYLKQDTERISVEAKVRNSSMLQFLRESYKKQVEHRAKTEALRAKAREYARALESIRVSIRSGSTPEAVLSQQQKKLSGHLRVDLHRRNHSSGSSSPSRESSNRWEKSTERRLKLKPTGKPKAQFKVIKHASEDSTSADVDSEREAQKQDVPASAKGREKPLTPIMEDICLSKRKQHSRRVSFASNVEFSYQNRSPTKDDVEGVQPRFNIIPSFLSTCLSSLAQTAAKESDVDASKSTRTGDKKETEFHSEEIPSQNDPLLQMGEGKAHFDEMTTVVSDTLEAEKRTGSAYLESTNQKKSRKTQSITPERKSQDLKTSTKLKRKSSASSYVPDEKIDIASKKVEDPESVVGKANRQKDEVKGKNTSNDEKDGSPASNVTLKFVLTKQTDVSPDEIVTQPKSKNESSRKSLPAPHLKKGSSSTIRSRVPPVNLHSQSAAPSGQEDSSKECSLPHGAVTTSKSDAKARRKWSLPVSLKMAGVKDTGQAGEAAKPLKEINKCKTVPTRTNHSFEKMYSKKRELSYSKDKMRSQEGQINTFRESADKRNVTDNVKRKSIVDGTTSINKIRSPNVQTASSFQKFQQKKEKNSEITIEKPLVGRKTLKRKVQEICDEKRRDEIEIQPDNKNDTIAVGNRAKEKIDGVDIKRHADVEPDKLHDGFEKQTDGVHEDVKPVNGEKYKQRMGVEDENDKIESGKHFESEMKTEKENKSYKSLDVKEMDKRTASGKQKHSIKNEDKNEVRKRSAELTGSLQENEKKESYEMMVNCPIRREGTCEWSELADIAVKKAIAVSINVKKGGEDHSAKINEVHGDKEEIKNDKNRGEAVYFGDDPTVNTMNTTCDDSITDEHNETLNSESEITAKKADDTDNEMIRNSSVDKESIKEVPEERRDVGECISEALASYNGESIEISENVYHVNAAWCVNVKGMSHESDVKSYKESSTHSSEIVKILLEEIVKTAVTLSDTTACQAVNRDQTGGGGDMKSNKTDELTYSVPAAVEGHSNELSSAVDFEDEETTETSVRPVNANEIIFKDIKPTKEIELSGRESDKADLDIGEQGVRASLRDGCAEYPRESNEYADFIDSVGDYNTKSSTSINDKESAHPDEGFEEDIPFEKSDIALPSEKLDVDTDIFPESLDITNPENGRYILDNPDDKMTISPEQQSPTIQESSSYLEENGKYASCEEMISEELKREINELDEEYVNESTKNTECKSQDTFTYGIDYETKGRECCLSHDSQLLGSINKPLSSTFFILKKSDNTRVSDTEDLEGEGEEHSQTEQHIQPEDTSTDHSSRREVEVSTVSESCTSAETALSEAGKEIEKCEISRREMISEDDAGDAELMPILASWNQLTTLSGPTAQNGVGDGTSVFSAGECSAEAESAAQSAAAEGGAAGSSSSRGSPAAGAGAARLAVGGGAVRRTRRGSATRRRWIDRSSSSSDRSSDNFADQSDEEDNEPRRRHRRLKSGRRQAVFEGGSAAPSFPGERDRSGDSRRRQALEGSTDFSADYSSTNGNDGDTPATVRTSVLETSDTSGDELDSENSEPSDVGSVDHWEDCEGATGPGPDISSDQTLTDLAAAGSDTPTGAVSDATESMCWLTCEEGEEWESDGGGERAAGGARRRAQAGATPPKSRALSRVLSDRLGSRLRGACSTLSQRSTHEAARSSLDEPSPSPSPTPSTTPLRRRPWTPNRRKGPLSPSPLLTPTDLAALGEKDKDKDKDGEDGKGGNSCVFISFMTVYDRDVRAMRARLGEGDRWSRRKCHCKLRVRAKDWALSHHKGCAMRAMAKGPFGTKAPSHGPLQRRLIKAFGSDSVDEARRKVKRLKRCGDGAHCDNEMLAVESADGQQAEAKTEVQTVAGEGVSTPCDPSSPTNPTPASPTGRASTTSPASPASPSSLSSPSRPFSSTVPTSTSAVGSTRSASTTTPTNPASPTSPASEEQSDLGAAQRAGQGHLAWRGDVGEEVPGSSAIGVAEEAGGKGVDCQETPCAAAAECAHEEDKNEVCGSACEEASVQQRERELLVHEMMSKSHPLVRLSRLPDVASVSCGLCDERQAVRPLFGAPTTPKDGSENVCCAEGGHSSHLVAAALENCACPDDRPSRGKSHAPQNLISEGGPWELTPLNSTFYVISHSPSGKPDDSVGDVSAKQTYNMTGPPTSDSTPDSPTTNSSPGLESERPRSRREVCTECDPTSFLPNQTDAIASTNGANNSQTPDSTEPQSFDPKSEEESVQALKDGQNDTPSPNPMDSSVSEPTSGVGQSRFRLGKCGKCEQPSGSSDAISPPSKEDDATKRDTSDAPEKTSAHELTKEQMVSSTYDSEAPTSDTLGQSKTESMNPTTESMDPTSEPIAPTTSRVGKSGVSASKCGICKSSVEGKVAHGGTNEAPLGDDQPQPTEPTSSARPKSELENTDLKGLGDDAVGGHDGGGGDDEEAKILAMLGGFRCNCPIDPNAPEEDCPCPGSGMDLPQEGAKTPVSLPQGFIKHETQATCECNKNDKHDMGEDHISAIEQEVAPPPKATCECNKNDKHDMGEDHISAIEQEVAPPPKATCECNKNDKHDMGEDHISAIEQEVAPPPKPPCECASELCEVHRKGPPEEEVPPAPYATTAPIKGGESSVDNVQEAEATEPTKNGEDDHTQSPSTQPSPFPPRKADFLCKTCVHHKPSFDLKFTQTEANDQLKGPEDTRVGFVLSAQGGAISRHFGVDVTTQLPPIFPPDPGCPSAAVDPDPFHFLQDFAVQVKRSLSSKDSSSKMPSIVSDAPLDDEENSPLPDSKSTRETASSTSDFDLDPPLASNPRSPHDRGCPYCKQH